MAIKRTVSNKVDKNSGKERLKFDVQCGEGRYTFTPSWSYQKLTITQVATILCDATIGTTQKPDQSGNINFTFTSEKTGNSIGFLNGVETDLDEDSTQEEKKQAIFDLRDILCEIEPCHVTKSKNADERQADIVSEFGE